MEKQKSADYSTLPVTKKVYEDIDNAAKIKLRNEHLMAYPFVRYYF